ncbi:MAG TPA: hypothetical protein VKZ63_00240 [Kofleriaceae bacterium]|nr:hypothetical protein [Kofleriaceae bacterium]
MKHEAILEELEAAASALSVKVSYESLQAIMGAGGLCRVRGEHRIIIDKRAQVGERVATLAQSLAKFDLSGVELSPAVRDLVRHYALRRAS